MRFTSLAVLVAFLPLAAPAAAQLPGPDIILRGGINFTEAGDAPPDVSTDRGFGWQVGADLPLGGGLFFIQPGVHYQHLAPQFSGLGEDDGVPFLVMEYLPGKDLRNILDSAEPLSIGKKIDIMVQVARGLHHAHRRSVYHRDVKPGNIRVLADGQVKIMDFGVAKILSEVPSDLTQTGTIVGTGHYMSPEQIQGLAIDHRSALFQHSRLGHDGNSLPIGLTRKRQRPPSVRTVAHDSAGRRRLLYRVR